MQWHTSTSKNSNINNVENINLSTFNVDRLI